MQTMGIGRRLVVATASSGAEEEHPGAEETTTGEDRQARVHPGEEDGRWTETSIVGEVEDYR